MKKLSLLILSLLAAIHIWAAETINSIDIDGVTFYYTVDSDGNATITNKTNSSSTENGYIAIINIVIPAEITDENGITYEVVSIAPYTFQSCTSLTSVVIPASVQEIGASAFNSCSSLKAVYFKAESKPKVGNNVFNYVSSDICYYVPYGCTGNYSFSPLAEFYFDNNFFYQLDEYNDLTIIYTTISTTATSITIPDTFTVDGTETTYTITAIESGLFANFTGLTEVFVNWTDPIGIDDEGLFPADIKEVATLYVPEGTVDAYTVSNWAGYFDNIGVYVDEEEQGEDRKDECGGTDDDGDEDEDNEPGTGTGEGGDDDVPGTEFDEGGGTDDDDDEENVPGTGTGEGGDDEGGGTDDDDDDNQDLDESTNYTVVDGIKYEIIDDDLVQIVGATAENIVFVTEVEIEESTYDVDSVVADAFIDYTDLTASVTFIDPEKIGVDGDSYSEKVGTLTVPDGCVDMYNRSDWTKIFTISGNDYLLSDDVYYIFKSSSLKSSSASKKITLEVDHIDLNATSVTIPEDIYLDDYGYFNVTSINTTAFENCDAIETLTIEADIPVTDAEALTTLSDNCILIVADVYEGKYDELLASTNITIITKSESVTNIKNLATEKVEVARYNILGQQLSAPCPGINLIKYSDGTVKKVIVK